MKLISIIIPTYNSEATLDIALKSVVNQNYNNIEVLIIDGLSTDTTLEIAEKYQKEFPNIIIKSEKDKGIYDAMNKGIVLAKGEWVYFMGSDDSLYNDEVLKKISEVERLSALDVIYGNVNSPRFEGIYDGVFTPKKIITKNICHQAIFINRRVFDKIGNFNLKYDSHADWDHNIRWFLSSKISKYFIDLVIANYADGGYSSQNDDLIFKKYLECNYPLISICIPTYNGKEFIAEAMDSAINQTYPNIEIVVSDDASKDNTIKVVESYKDKTDIPIHIFQHQPNGIGANWNHSVRIANGDYIKFLFQDDILKPTCIEEMVNIAIRDKDVGMVYCKRNIIYDKNDEFSNEWVSKSGVLHKSWKKINSVKTLVSGKELLLDEYLLNAPKNKFGEPTAVLIKKSVFDKVGFFDENLKQLLDLEFWYRILKHFDIGFVDEELVSFRLHPNQATQLNHSDKINELDLLSKLSYKKYFWKVHPKTRIFLFKKHNSIVWVYRYFRNLFKTK